MSEKIKHTIIIVVATFVCLFLIASIIVISNGKQLVSAQLEYLLQRKVAFDSVKFSPLFDIEIKGLQIKDMGRIEFVSISPTIAGVFIWGIPSSIKIVKPKIIYDRNILQKTYSQPNRNQIRRFLIFKNLNIIDGRFDFVDAAGEADSIKITVNNIQLNVSSSFVFPNSMLTRFSLTGKMPWLSGGEEGQLDVKGWVNPAKKDIAATIKISDIDGIYLYPYYSHWADVEKSRIEKAKLNFTGDIKGKNNLVTANCHLELTDIIFKPRPQDQQPEQEERMAHKVLNAFKSMNNGKVVLDFTIRTKLDRPEFGFGHVKSAFNDKVAECIRNKRITLTDVVKFPVRLVTGTVKGTADLSTAMFKGTTSLGKELKDALLAAFRKN